MEPTEALLRRLALNDENAVHSVLQPDAGASVSGVTSLDRKTHALVRLAALLSMPATTESCRLSVELAHAAGASDDEIVSVLVAVAPAVGSARLVAAAPRLALAIGYDMEDEF
jgi:4-carboxymuconolactone decarboxylase